MFYIRLVYNMRRNWIVLSMFSMCVSITLGEQFSQHAVQKINLTLYYESLCPDSIKFIRDQLYPAMYYYNDYVTVEYVPFGKSQSIDGGRQFLCQHGQAECQGNRVQGCTLAHAHHTRHLPYVLCEMTSGAGSEGNLECVRSLGLPLERVSLCVDSEEGTQLQLHLEKLTNSVKPSFVPTITINGIFDQRIQDDAQHNLIGVFNQLLGF